MWREGKWCTTSRGDSSVQGIAGREGKNIPKNVRNIPKNVRSKIFIKLFVPRYLSNFLDFSITFLNVFGALRARSLVPIQLRQQVKRTLRSSATPQEVCVDDGWDSVYGNCLSPSASVFALIDGSTKTAIGSNTLSLPHKPNLNRFTSHKPNLNTIDGCRSMSFKTRWWHCRKWCLSKYSFQSLFLIRFLRFFFVHAPSVSP